MCGIVGIISFSKNQFFQAQQKTFRNLLYLDAFRGEDGTGVFGVSRTGNVEMLKAEDPAGRFIYTPEYKEFEKGMYSTFDIVVGHNRKATVGKINHDTAHPFISGNVVMVHNGKLFAHEKYHKTEVDSEALCKYLEEHENDLDKAIPELDGHFSVVWYNAQTRKFRFWRNKDRPMYHAIVGSYLYFSSERSILTASMIRAGVSPVDKDIYELEENKIWTLDMTKPTLKWEVTQLETKVKEYPKSNYHTYGYYGACAIYGSDETAETIIQTPTTPTKEKTKSSTITTKPKISSIKGKSDILTLSDLIGQRIIFKMVDAVENIKNEKENWVEGYFADDVTVSCLGAPKEFFEDLETWPHEAKFFRATVQKVTKSGNSQTFDIEVEPNIELYKGFVAANGTLVSYEMIKDIGGEEYIFCSNDACYNNILAEEWETASFKFKYRNSLLEDHEILCAKCIKEKKEAAKSKAIVLVGEKLH